MADQKPAPGRKKNLTGIIIVLIITALLSALLSVKFTHFERLEEKLYDYRFKVRGTSKVPDNIIIAAIDEKSIGSLGRWPWSRDKMARLIEKLTESGAEIIMMDIIFSEPEKNDPMLAKDLRDAGNIILPVVFDFDRDSETPDSEFLANSAFVSVTNPELFKTYSPIMSRSVLAPVPALSKEAMSVGHINMLPDADGTVRWEPLIIGYKGSLYPSLDLSVAAAYLGIPKEKIVLDATKGIYLGKKYIFSDPWGRMLINYYGPDNTFSRISISDILDGAVKKEMLQGKIVLVGPTAVGIYDLRVTPFSPVMPGIEKHASVIASIIEGRFIKSAPLSVNLLILLLSGLFFSVAVTRFRAAGAGFVTVLFLLGISVSGYYMFAVKGIWINMLYPLANFLLSFISVTAYNYAVEEKYARKIRAMFSNYVTERLVSEMIRNPEIAKLGGERREVTVLFSDVRGFTSFSEKHAPEDVVAILNEYLQAMTEIVFKWEGVLDKFIGDAIVAFWGAPLQQENHSELAVKCSLEMIKRLGELRGKWQAEGKDPLDTGIGINTGEVIVGNIGAEGMKMDYTVIGDHVNLGARIESLTRKYDTHILITEFTLNNLRRHIEEHKIGHVLINGMEKVVVKGKEMPVGIYEVRTLPDNENSIITEPEKDKVVRFTEK